MDSISSILSDKDFKEPEEVEQLKSYIKSAYNAQSEILITPKGLTIVVTNSSLANTLRLNLPQIKRQLKIDRPLNIRIR